MRYPFITRGFLCGKTLCNKRLCSFHHQSTDAKFKVYNFDSLQHFNNFDGNLFSEHLEDNINLSSTTHLYRDNSALLNNFMPDSLDF